MATYTVTVTRSYSVDVDVEADTPEAAADIASRRNFPLPPLQEWQGMKDWLFAVYQDGELVHELD